MIESFYLLWQRDYEEKTQPNICGIIKKEWLGCSRIKEALPSWQEVFTAWWHSLFNLTSLYSPLCGGRVSWLLLSCWNTTKVNVPDCFNLKSGFLVANFDGTFVMISFLCGCCASLVLRTGIGTLEGMTAWYGSTSCLVVCISKWMEISQHLLQRVMLVSQLLLLKYKLSVGKKMTNLYADGSH